MRDVIVHADDFGLHHAINSGIETAHRSGIVTSASIMPLGLAFEDAVARCHTLPSLDIGLHYALVGVPGAPSNLKEFFSNFLRGRISSASVRGSLHRQLDMCLTQGLRLTHIDSHQHLHALPGIMRIVCQTAREYGIPCIRLPDEGPALASISLSRRSQAALLTAISRLSRRILRANKIRTTEHFRGMAVSGHLTAAVIAAYLREAGKGATEIVCHPGDDNSQLSASYNWGYNWYGEMTALCAAEVYEVVQSRQIRLIGWDRIGSETA